MPKKPRDPNASPQPKPPMTPKRAAAQIGRILDRLSSDDVPKVLAAVSAMQQLSFSHVPEVQS
jgi:hypothetical protein